MNNTIRIPVASQIRVDDVGWHNGADERFKNRPARSGFPRNHHADDYIILNELGRALDMKIACSLVLGEWDKNNRLRGVPHVTYNEKGWDRAAEIDYSYAEKAFAHLNDGEFLECTIHGLNHSYYENDKLVSARQYYPRDWQAISAEEFRRHIELFVTIYNDWGFTKKLRTFSSPCGCAGTPEDNRDFARVLREHGILYWPNGWSFMKNETVGVTEGIICMKGFGVVPWNAYDVDPKYLPFPIAEDYTLPMSDFCLHWTNFLHFYPEDGMNYLPDWIAYFKKHAEIFGVMLSRDMEFAASQVLYCRHAQVDITENTCLVDLRNVDSIDAVGKRNEFYISFRNGTEPKACEGGSIELYETKQNFRTYKIVRTVGNTVKIAL